MRNILTRLGSSAKLRARFPPRILEGAESSILTSTQTPVRLGITLQGLVTPAQQRSAIAVKKFLLSCVAVAVLAGSQGTLCAQAKEAVAEHKVGLIDMAYLFTNYQKFKDLREELKGEIQTREDGIKAEVEKLRESAEHLKGLKPGSDEAIKLEKTLTAAQAKIEADKQNAKRELFRQESKIYQAVYGEVTDAVALYAQHYSYTLILRFTREENVSDDPSKVMQALQRQVVYNKAEDDITDKVLSYLNKEYGKVRPASGTAKAKTRASVE